MDKELIILGDFNGHLEYIGTQKLDKNVQIELFYFFVFLLNDLPESEWKVIWKRDDQRNTIQKKHNRLYFSKCRAISKRFKDMKIDEEGEKICPSDNNIWIATFRVDTLNRKDNTDKEEVTSHQAHQYDNIVLKHLPCK